MTGKLHIDNTGRLQGPAFITHNSPWPCVNGSWGSGVMNGVIMHTMVGDLPGTVSVFNEHGFDASAQFGISQDGHIHQFGPIDKSWIAWHVAAGNSVWYGIEHADHGNPLNPLTEAQLDSSAQVVECLSAEAGFPLKEADTPAEHGYGVHYMGGAAWGGHSPLPVDRTEFLTRSGWKSFADLHVGDEVASWSADSGEVSFATFIRKTDVFESATVVRAGIETSLEHRFYVNTVKNDAYKAIAASELSVQHRVPLTGHYTGAGLPLSDDEIRMLLAIESDGSIMRSDHGRRMPKGVAFRLTRPRKIARLRVLLASLGVRYRESVAPNEPGQPVTVFRIYDAAWTQNHVLRWLPGKSLGWDWLEASDAQADVILSEIMEWDGCKSQQKFKSSAETAAVLQAISHLHGQRATIDAQGMLCFPKAERGVAHAQAMSRTQGSREGVLVGCITTENDTIIIRQDKRRVAILGNCPDVSPRRVRSLQRLEILRRAKRLRLDAPPVRHLASGNSSLLYVANRRHSTPAHIMHVTRHSPISATHLAEFNAYVKTGVTTKMPRHLVFYTSH